MAQRDLMVSNYKMGGVFQESAKFQQAKRRYQAGIDVLDRMIANGQSIELSKRGKAFFERQLKQCKNLILATGPWSQLIDEADDALPSLLLARCTWLARQGKTADVLQAAQKLAALEPKTSDNLYNTACRYGLYAQLVGGWKGRGDYEPAQQLDPKSQSLFQQHRSQAIELLKSAIESGFADFDHIRQDPDLAALRNMPEFQMLLKQEKKK